MDIPSKPYVGLYGSHSGDWRSVCARALSNYQISWYDPTDKQWDDITDENGDSYQTLIDELVAKQHQGMLNASCVVFHLAQTKSYSYEENKPKPEDKGQVLTAFAARCELGFLIGSGIQTFVHIEKDVRGRNYLWAAMKNYKHMVRSQTLEEATGQASDYILSLDSFKR
jgi:hypothetical protein